MKAILLSLGLLVIPISFILMELDVVSRPSIGMILILLLVTAVSWINGVDLYLLGIRGEEEFHLLGQTVFWLFTLSVVGYIAFLILNEILSAIYEVLKAIYA